MRNSNKLIKNNNNNNKYNIQHVLTQLGLIYHLNNHIHKLFIHIYKALSLLYLLKKLYETNM